MKYKVDMSQTTGDAWVVDRATRERVATFLRKEHGAETLYRAQEEADRREGAG